MSVLKRLRCRRKYPRGQHFRVDTVCLIGIMLIATDEATRRLYGSE